MNKKIQAVIDAEETTLSADDVDNTSKSIRLAVGRNRFDYQTLLPNDLADALELVNQEDPADAFAATLILLCGYSGLLKLGNRVQLSARYSVPINLFVASVGPSGLSKTGHTKKLIDAPSAHIRKDYKESWEHEIQEWQQQCKSIKKDADRPPKPLPLYPHQKNYTPEDLEM